MSESQINSLNFVADVDDQATGPANSAAEALKNLGTAADTASAGLDGVDKSGTSATSTVSTRLLPSMTQLNRVLDDSAASTAKLAAVEAQRQRYLDALAQSQGAATTAGLSYQDAQQKINDKFDAQVAKIVGVQAAVVEQTASLVANRAEVVASTEASTAHAGILNTVANAFGVQKYAVVEATDELHKFADQVLAGGSALSASFYQLPNIGQALGGFGNIAKVVGGLLIGPAGIVIGAAAASLALYELGSHAEAQQEQLAALGQQLRATVTDYAAVAASAQGASRYIASTSDVSQPNALAAVKTFDAVSTVDGTSTSQLAALTKQAADLATVLGTTVPDAAKMMAAAMADPEKAAEDFESKGLLGVNEQLVQQVKDLQDSGNTLGAYAALAAQVQVATANAATAGLTPFQQALLGLHEAMAGPVDDAKKFGSSVGDYIVAGATKAVGGITAIVGALKELDGHLNGNDFSPAATAAPSASVSSTINSVGASLGAPSDVISLAQRIAPVESSTGQFTSSGSVVTSSTGALGALQVEPSNANGNDLSTLTGNVTAAEQLLISLYQKYSGNQILVAMAYNWGEGNVDAYLSHQISSVPQGVLNYAQQVTGGAAYSRTTTSAMSNTVNQALSTGDTTTAAQVDAETRSITLLTTAQGDLNKLHDAGGVSDDDYASETAKLTSRLNEHQGALEGLRDPLQTLTHNQDLATASAATSNQYQAAMVQVDQQVEAAAQKMGQAHATVAQILAAETGKQQQLTAEFNASVAAIDQNTVSITKLTAGYDGTQGTLTHYLNEEQAAEKVRATSSGSSAEQARQVAIYTAALDGNAAALADQTTAAKLYGQTQDLQYIAAETDALGQNTQVSSVNLAVLKERQAILARNGDLASAASQEDLANVATIQRATNAYQQQQQALTDLSGGLSGVFSTLGDDITQAFTAGSGSAVTFKSVLPGLETQVASLVIKFAIINPLMNDLFGGNATTLSGIVGALGSTGGGSAGGGSSGIGSLASLGGSAASLAGGGGLLSSLGLGGVGASVSGLLGTQLIAGSPITLAGIDAAPIGTSSIAGVGASSGATLGSFLGGAGAGFGAGMLLNSLVGGKSTGGTIGSAGGALAGAAIGSIIPGVGTLIGGLVGGAGGGLLGGLFGGGKKNPYTLDTVSTSGGQLSIGSSYNQAETDQTTVQLQADISALNATFKSLGLSVSAGNGNAQGNLGIVGDGAKNAQASISSYLNAIRFGGATGSFNTALQQGVSGGFSTSDLSSVSSFDAAITALKQMADVVDALRVKAVAFNADAGTVTVGGAGSFTGYSVGSSSALDYALDGKTLSTSDLSSQISTITTFVDSTMPSLLSATNTGASDFQNQLTTLTSTYTSAETEAASLGIGTDSLAAKLKSLTADMYATAQASLDTQTSGYQARDYTATGDPESAALLNQQLSASQELTAFNASWQAIYGNAYQQAVGYGDALNTLTKTQADERLAIEQQYNDQRLQQQQNIDNTWLGAVTSAYTAQSELSDDGTTAGKIASLGYAKNGALLNFDDTEGQTIAAFQKTFTDAYGDAILQTSGFAAAMSQEETTLGLQRLAIAKGYDDQIAEVTAEAAQAQAQANTTAQNAATSIISNLGSYATSLATSSTSPLSAADQYAAAKANERSTAALAQNGDPTALGNLQSTLQTFLSISQTYNAGGAGFASDYGDVQAVLSNIGGLSTDTLTASFYAQQQETSTQTLVDSLSDLKAQVVKLQQITRTAALVGATA